MIAQAPFPPWRGTVSVRRRGEVGGVQAIDLCVQGCERAGVVEHVVGGGQTLRPTGLRGHDGADLFIDEPAARTHARDCKSNSQSVGTHEARTEIGRRPDCGRIDGFEAGTAGQFDGGPG